jgi:hypothetical protein
MKNSFVSSLAILVMLAGTASASLIAGELGFVGSFTPNSTPLSTATALTFPSASIVGATGDFLGIPLGALPFSGFTFSPDLLPNPLPLWNTGGFSFDMTSLSIDLQTNTNLLLSGVGTLKGTGFTDTPGQFNFTGNTLGAIFTFSAGNVNATPEPTSVLVWGGLVAGVLGVKRRSLR